MSNKLCIFCEKEFANKQNATRHQKICKQKPNENLMNTKEYEKILNLLDDQKKEIESLKNKLKKLKRPVQQQTITISLYLILLNH